MAKLVQDHSFPKSYKTVVQILQCPKVYNEYTFSEVSVIESCFRNERSLAAGGGGRDGALDPFDAAFAMCFDIRMAAAAMGNAARSEAEARAARLEAKLRALEEQEEVRFQLSIHQSEPDLSYWP